MNISRPGKTGELMPRQMGKSVAMKAMLDAYLDAGHSVLVVSHGGAAVHKRHKKHKHITIITPVQRR